MLPSNLLPRLIVSGALMLLVIAAGFFLHRTGKPYHTVVFTIHKLCTLAMAVLMVLVVIHFPGLPGRSWSGITFTVVMALSLAGLLVSGGMMGLDKLQWPMLFLHRASSAGFVVCYGILLYRVILHTV